MREFFRIPDDHTLTVDQATILRCRLEAMRGSHQHMQFWSERTEGKVKDVLQIEPTDELAKAAREMLSKD
jgi:hypothetical protein